MNTYRKLPLNRPSRAPWEPEEDAVVCRCTRCRKKVYLDGRTYQDGMGSDLCEDCFRELISRRMRESLPLLAWELGYEVVRHEG